MTEVVSESREVRTPPKLSAKAERWGHDRSRQRKQRGKDTTEVVSESKEVRTPPEVVSDFKHRA